MRRTLWILLAAVVPFPVHATAWYVTAGGTGSQDGTNWDNALPTVTAGLQKAQSGDSVQVWIGYYPERITLKAGVVLSGGYFFGGAWLPFLSILDGGGGGTVVTVPPGAGSGTTMEGFTIQNGTGTLLSGKTYGGGVLIQNASPTLRYNHVTNNRADVGAGLYLSGSGADINTCHLTRNTATERGGGAAIEGGDPMLYIATIRGNSAPVGGGVHATGVNTLLLMDNVFEANHAETNGSAAYLDRGLFANNTVLRNRGSAVGAVALAHNGGATFINNIVAYNTRGVWIGRGAKFTIRCNDVFANGSENYFGVSDPTGADGNISKPPCLMDPLVGNYTPAPGSPCVDKGYDAIIQTGWVDYYLKPRISGVAADIGAAEWQQPAPKAAIRVKPASQGGSDQFGGASWSAAMATVQAAITRAQQYDSEVWVAAGTYNGFKIEYTNVMIFGGFAGNETKRNQRDPATYPTILEGPNYNSAVIILSGGPSWQKIDARTVVDGFTIRGGNGNDVGTEPLGGGIFCQDSSPVISGNIIEKNNADFSGHGRGGGLYLQDGSPVVSCNTIRDNESELGGGLYLFYGSPVIRNNVISGNDAGFGAGIMTDHSYPTVTGNTILGNTAQTSGGGVSSVQGKIVLRDNRIMDNVSNGAGGGARLEEAEVTHNVFSGNEAPQGAAALDQLGKAVIANNLFVRNKTTGYVGGIAAALVEAAITNNTVAYNQGRGVHLVPGTVNQTLHNNIIAFNATGLLAAVQSTGTLTASHNCVWGNTKDYDIIGPIPSDIHADPRFTDVTVDDFRLRFDSPCIDAGHDAARFGEADVYGQMRLNGPHVDIGACEYALDEAVGLPGAVDALRIAGGLDACGPASIAALNVETAGASQNCVDMRDVCRLLRTEMGLD